MAVSQRDWLVRAAAHLGVDQLEDAEIEALLDLARDVAHTSERRYAPLTCFLVGLAAAQDRDGVVRSADDLARLARRASEALGED